MNQTPQEITGLSTPNEETIPVTETQSSPQSGLWVHILLFGLTALSTLYAGSIQKGVNPFTLNGLIQGVPFSFTLLAILLTHEMGHYLTSRGHHVDASLPYFIPAPSFIGTFGAFIRMRSPIMDKRALLDIGASGPIAGFVVSIFAVAIGLRYSEVIPTQNQMGGIGLGSPLVFELISNWIIGPVEEGFDVILHPIAFAGWIGLFVTALNLIPIGQLDGGHVVYAILGRGHRWVSIAMIPILVTLGFFGWAGWYVWAVIPLIMGIGHPPTMNPDEELDRTRRIIGWTTLIIFVLCFTPEPFKFLP